jgi:hypothetical protein
MESLLLGRWNFGRTCRSLAMTIRAIVARSRRRHQSAFPTTFEEGGSSAGGCIAAYVRAGQERWVGTAQGAVRRMQTSLRFSWTNRSQAAINSRHSRRAASRSNLNLALLSIFR